MNKDATMIEPAFTERNIPVVFATDQNYALYSTVFLQSLIRNSSAENNYDLILFEDSLPDSMKEKLASLVLNRKNFSLRFFSLEQELQKYPENIFYSPAYYSKTIYFRLFIPTILQNYKKVIYLDIDTILLADVAELFATQLEEKPVAAYIEPPMKRFFSTPDYFNSGVLVMNIPKLNELDLLKQSLAVLSKYTKLASPDQDVLNMLYTGNFISLSFLWNFFAFAEEKYIKKTSGYDAYKEILLKKKSPNLIHYASWQKPWNTPEGYFSELWWRYARQLPFFPAIERQSYIDQAKTFRKKYWEITNSTAWKMTYPLRNLYDLCKYNIPIFARKIQAKLFGSI